jgi:hypothetical protein
VYLLRVADPDSLTAVCAFLRRVHVDVQERSDGTLSVSVVGAASPLHEWRELTGYVTTWNALNPGTHVELTDVTG